VRRLLQRDPQLWLSTSVTTRAPRPGECDGVDYRFVDGDEFCALRDAGGLLEWFEVFGDLKGTPREPVLAHLAAGDDVVLEIDVHGALAVREVFPDALLVFIAPPSRAEQRRRLLTRAGDSPEDVERRLEGAAAEERLAGTFDAVVVNDDIDTAVEQVAAILKARRAESR